MTLRSRVEKIANAELIKVQYPDYVSIEKETIALVWSVIRDYQQLLDRAIMGLEDIRDSHIPNINQHLSVIPSEVEEEIITLSNHTDQIITEIKLNLDGDKA